MIEAVADAATGEFERLKSLASKPKTMAILSRLRLKAVTETSKNNAAEIGISYPIDTQTLMMKAWIIDGARLAICDSWNAFL